MMMKDEMNMFGSEGDPFWGGWKWWQLKNGDVCMIHTHFV